jgi:hypothetical protein
VSIMTDLMVFGGVVVALAGVVQVASRHQSRAASPVALLREGMMGLEGSEAEALRAEFRRSGVAVPDRRHVDGF